MAIIRCITEIYFPNNTSEYTVIYKSGCRRYYSSRYSMPPKISKQYEHMEPYRLIMYYNADQYEYCWVYERPFTTVEKLKSMELYNSIECDGDIIIAKYNDDFYGEKIIEYYKMGG